MASANRSRITLRTLGGAWEQLTTGTMPLPPTAEKIGLVCYGSGTPQGVLIRYKTTGLYALWQAGGVKSLPQDKAKAAHNKLAKTD